MDINKIKKNGKLAIANALVEIEQDPFSRETLLLLSEAYKVQTGYIIGITGPPGVGKSSLIKNLITNYRNQRKTVAVVAVDPSSKKTGGALLGDRIRLESDPDDQGLFIRSMAARDKLGGLASITLSSVFLLNAIFDFIIIETVGVGQSETDIAHIADTVLFCVQPGSGDSLQFMKAGIVEIPDIVAITKSDLGEVADNTFNDISNSLKLSVSEDKKEIPVVNISTKENKNISNLIEIIDQQKRINSSTTMKEQKVLQKSMFWLEESVKEQLGINGIKKLRKIKVNASSPFMQYLDLIK